MALKVEHELHDRRRGRNMGVLAVLIAFIVMVFGLTVVKVMTLGDMGLRNRMDPPGNVVPDPNFQPSETSN